MTLEVIAAVGTLAVGIVVVLLGRRAQCYRHLAQRVDCLSKQPEELAAVFHQQPVPDFSRRLAVVPDLLPQGFIEALRNEAEALSPASSERSFVPTHKKGGTIAYATIIEEAPLLAAFYHSHVLMSYVSRLVGTPVQPTPLHDQNSLSLLFYDRPGDHIGWHYDHNFYRGRHFTVLLPLLNLGTAEGGLSHAKLQARHDNQPAEVSTRVNTLVVFEGAKVLHRVTPIGDGERRIVMSMTYCADPQHSAVQGGARRIKDIAFFGVRALWT